MITTCCARIACVCHYKGENCPQMSSITHFLTEWKEWRQSFSLLFAACILSPFQKIGTRVTEGNSLQSQAGSALAIEILPSTLHLCDSCRVGLNLQQRGPLFFPLTGKHLGGNFTLLVKVLSLPFKTVKEQNFQGGREEEWRAGAEGQSPAILWHLLKALHSSPRCGTVSSEIVHRSNLSAITGVGFCLSRYEEVQGKAGAMLHFSCRARSYEGRVTPAFHSVNPGNMAEIGSYHSQKWISALCIKKECFVQSQLICGLNN